VCHNAVVVLLCVLNHSVSSRVCSKRSRKTLPLVLFLFLLVFDDDDVVIVGLLLLLLLLQLSCQASRRQGSF
jgi:hypothetical protein